MKNLLLNQIFFSIDPQGGRGRAPRALDIYTFAKRGSNGDSNATPSTCQYKQEAFISLHLFGTVGCGKSVLFYAQSSIMSTVSLTVQEKSSFTWDLREYQF